MKKITQRVIAIIALTVSGSHAAVLWSENFTGATVGTISTGNDVLAGTAVASKNALTLEVAVAPGAFTYSSGNVLRISTTGNQYAAVVPSALLTFPAVANTDAYTLSFDLYIPSTLTTPVGDWQPRLEAGGEAGNGSSFSGSAVSAAGQYHIVYTGLISDIINGAGPADTAFPFLGFDQGTATAAGIAYIDNIHFEVGPPPVTLPFNAAYFANLKANVVASSPLVQWQQFGPGMSGYIDKFWINNGDPNAMYTQLDMGNGHVTLNRGEFWRTYKENDGNGLPAGITGIEFSYQNPDFGLMMAKEGIYSTTNRGVRWDFVLDIDTSNSQMHSVLTVDPNNDQVWYIGAGQHWMIKDTHFNQNGLIYSKDGNYSSGFILKSTDKGQSWTKITSVFPADSDFSKIIVDPRNGNVVYASNQHGLYKSTNAGMSWALVAGNGLPYNQPRDMGYYYDGANEFLLYLLEVTHYDTNGSSIATSGGVYRSADGGANWDNLTGDLGIDMTRISSWGYQQKYWRAIAWWLETTTANVQALYPDYPTNTFSQFIRIAVDPTNKDRIYLVHNFKHDYSFPPGNIWMTENGGTNWYAAAREGPYWVNGQDAAYWNSRAIQPMGANVTYAHVHKEHYDQDDTSTGPRFVFCNQLGEVYTAFAQQVMRSTDHGASWKQIDDDETVPGNGHWVGRGDCNLPGETFCLETGTPGTYLWGSGEHGLWRNTHDGDLVYPGAIAVEQLTGQSHFQYDSTSISCIAVDPADTNKIYTLQFRQGHKGELRYSSDAGSTWITRSTPVNFPAANDVIDQRSLLIDPATPDTLYFCIPLSEWERWSGPSRFNGPTGWTGHGIYKSTDGGLSFSMITNGIPAGSSVYRMAMDPFDSKTLYAALNESHLSVPGGLYKTTDGGTNWNPVSIPAGIVSVNDVVVHKTTGNIYIACGTRSDAGETGGGFISQDGGLTWHLSFDMPYLRHFEPSQANPDIIAVNVDKAGSIGQINPGAYVTIDGGASWTKINNRHGQPDGIRKIEPDPYDPNILWMSNHGTGFFKMDISPLSTGQPKENFFWDWMAGYAQTDRTADTDGDGFDNRLEYIAGSNPNDGTNVFSAAGVPVGADYKLTIDSALNRSYTVEFTDDLMAGWGILTNGLSGTGDPVELLDTAGSSNRFYRVRVKLQ